MNETPDNSVSLHLTKLLDKHLLRDGRYCPRQLGKTKNLPAKQVKENHQLPAALKNLQDILDALSR